MPTAGSSVIPAMRYKDAPAAIEWLTRVLGFERRAVYDGPNGSVGHAELALGNGMIMLGSEKDDEHARRFKAPMETGGVETRSVYLVVADVNAVYARTQAAGAQVIRPIADTPYGSREFTVLDPEGHSWSVGTYDPWVAPS
jgi:uncharacterized glyoxalase superfamily protein PhnB